MPQSECILEANAMEQFHSLDPLAGGFGELCWCGNNVNV
jgi:hypothetical protein